MLLSTQVIKHTHLWVWAVRKYALIKKVCYKKEWFIALRISTTPFQKMASVESIIQAHQGLEKY